jgi:hypothetical protein
VSGRYLGPSETGLQADIDQVREHLSWWFGSIHAGKIELGFNNPATGQLTRFRRFGVDDIDAMAELTLEVNQVPGQNTYHRICALREDLASDTPARDGDEIFVPGYVVDADDDRQLERARSFCDETLACNAEVITGIIPYERGQMLWRLEDPSGFEPGLSKRLAKAVGSDPAVSNPTTYLRIGGSIAWPYKPGREVEVTQFSFTNGKRFYPASIIADHLLPQLKEPEVSVSPPSVTWDRFNSELGLDYKRMIRDIEAGVDRHDNTLRLTASLVAKGYDDFVIQDWLTRILAAGPAGGNTLDELPGMIKSAREKFVPEAEISQDHEPYPPIVLESADYDTPPPPRPFLYGHAIIRGYITVIAAPGGSGKTALATIWATAMATGQMLLNDQPKRTLRVSYWTLEDPRAEMRARIIAVRQHFNLDPTTLAHNLKLNSGRDRRLLLAHYDDQHNPVVGADVNAIITALRDENIDVLFLDPPLRAHGLDEISNNDQDFFLDTLGRIAEGAGIAIVLVMHTRKGFNPGEADSVRGATSIVAGARLVLTIATMTTEEARQFNIHDDERRFYRRIDEAKTNLKPPAERAQWFRLESVSLDNGDAEYPDGDMVQVATPWTQPEPKGEFDSAFGNAVLDEMHQHEATELHTRVRSNGARESTPEAIFHRVGVDRGQKPPLKSFIVDLLKDWLANGILEVVNADGAKDQQLPNRTYPQLYVVRKRNCLGVEVAL